MTTALQPHDTLLFIGDSITDCDRCERDSPLGRGYVRMVSDLLAIRDPAKRIKIINHGISGNTVENLRSRWSDHVLAHKPDWLVVKIGINDINRYLSDPKNNPNQSSEAFASLYEQIVALTRNKLPDTQIVLVSPFFASVDATPDSYRTLVLANLPSYIDAVQAIAQRHHARFVDLHAAVLGLLESLPPAVFAEDAVHPTHAGALFIAEQVYAALLQ